MYEHIYILILKTSIVYVYMKVILNDIVTQCELVKATL